MQEFTIQEVFDLFGKDHSKYSGWDEFEHIDCPLCVGPHNPQMTFSKEANRWFFWWCRVSSLKCPNSGKLISLKELVEMANGVRDDLRDGAQSREAH